MFLTRNSRQATGCNHGFDRMNIQHSLTTSLDLSDLHDCRSACEVHVVNNIKTLRRQANWARARGVSQLQSTAGVVRQERTAQHGNGAR